jgi:long-chain acyl-CoA synthetase
MEAGTVAPAAASTGSKTIADMLALAAEHHHGEAQRYKKDGEWQSVSFEELARTVSEIARGLIDLGIQHGERVSLLCATRPEWTSSDFAISSAGAVVVPIYPTNSPSECEWVAGNSESVAIVVEDDAQLAKIVEVRENLPDLQHVIVIEPSGDIGDAISLDELRERGRGRDEAELRARTEAVTPDDTYTIIYTSGTTGPPKGCVLSHRNYRQVVNMTEEFGVVEEGDVIYLFIPL